MKTNSCIYLLPFSSVFNPQAVETFEFMDKEHSAFLYSTLYFNNVEVIEKFKNRSNIILCLDKADEQVVPLELKSLIFNVDICNISDYPAAAKQLNEKYFSKYQKNLIIFSRAIGFSSSEIQKVLDLLPADDEKLVIGKANNGRIAFLAFTAFHEDILKDIWKTDFSFDTYISMIFKHNYFVTVLEKMIYINDKHDFRVLYSELSKKESLTYCSQRMHEQFTHLFIEYKEQVK